MRFAVDTGGTFTDLVLEDDHGLCRLYKARTTPADPISGVIDALALAADDVDLSLSDLLEKGDVLIHGTTHAINALITGRTAKTALLTTEGHGDMLVLREGGRDNAFDFSTGFPGPFIPRSLTYEVPERVRSDGGVMTALDEAAVSNIIADLEQKGVEAVAVCLLWSVVNPAHEERIGALLAEQLPDVPFTLSHRLNPAIREFRRASSAAVDASLKPIMGHYMRSLESRLRDSGFAGRTLIVTSQGGVIDAADAADAPIHIVNSGPSMAPIAGRYFSALDSDLTDAIIADTGGTTYDVSIVRGGTIPTSRETAIGDRYRGIMIGFPWVDVKSVGAGGGSIAGVDSGGLLHVGPRSAGAVPGPAAYGRGGTEPTVTDASLVLGHIDPDYFLGGTMQLDPALAQTAVREKVADLLDLNLAAAADAIIAIATENMVQAILDITVKQGIDPRHAVLVGGGGAAGLNSVRIARRLGCRYVIVPAVGPALSAAGALMSDLKAEFHAARVVKTDRFDFDAVQHTLTSLEARCRTFAEGPGAGALETLVSFRVDARYATQVWEIEVELGDNRLTSPADVDAFVSAFHKAHKVLFSFDDPASSIEIVGWTAQVNCRFHERPELRLASGSEDGRTAGHRPAYFSATGQIDVPVYRMDAMGVGETVIGPAIIESAYTTVVVDPGATAMCRPSNSLVIDLGAST